MYSSFSSPARVTDAKRVLLLSIVLIVIYPIIEFFESSDVPLLLRILVAFGLLVWAIWSFLAEKEAQERARNYFCIDIPRDYSVSCRHPDSKIFPAPLHVSEFMDAYRMSEIDFRDRIVRRGIQLAMQECIDEHPEALMYTPPSYD